MRSIRLAGGLRFDLPGAPAPRLLSGTAISRVGWEAADFARLRPRLARKPGDQVRAGDCLMVDRRRSAICFTAPHSGTLRVLELGAQRRLERLEIELEAGLEPREFATDDASCASGLRQLMQSSGLWPALRARPFGGIPDPEAVPAALFVQAIDTQPLAADPLLIIEPHRSEFERGLKALCLLGSGPVFVCQAAETPCIEPGAQITPVRFVGRHPAGLPGTHVHQLLPAGRRQVWEIHYQEVIALGHLLEHGRLWPQRWIAVAGADARQPAIYALPVAADLAELAPTLAASTTSAIISGSPLHGRLGRYLGRRHYQISVLPPPRSDATGWRGWSQRRRSAIGAMLALEQLDTVFPFGLPATPLLRALSVGDDERAVELGALQLLEEDLDLLSHVCVSGVRYGALLRRTLQAWEAGS
ncbi:hypothetical protein [Pseudomarimonas arenosa]|uniref:Na(+)-translocating NADH-quinone reductase subunit A n=1 Tax=Pseudomarimonas arenosa TaxID=2774145 RepID=A0AAW3ZKY8_9GAMM|nr:hypothetical protein [Pseudomarimonas arenosa]MBD8526115.1 hypothetical protein [Pseudomarimonas arenosa]